MNTPFDGPELKPEATLEATPEAGTGAEAGTALARDEPRPESLARVPARGVYSEAARLQRLEFARAQTGAALPQSQAVGLDAGRLVGNVENLVGSVEIPVGLAGPLMFHGEAMQGTAYAPIATLEGSLVASMCRGAMTLNRSGGVRTRVLGQRMVRAPSFLFRTLDQAIAFSRWVEANEESIAAHAHIVSRHARLVKLESTVLNRWAHVRFVYETADAAGQNMTTACTWHASQWILEQIRAMSLDLVTFYVEGNLSGDKKVTFDSMISGRGTRVVAECELSAAAIESVLKISVDEFLRGYRGSMSAALHIGAVGYNANIANVLAGMFAATGQDLGCVHESSIGQLYAERTAHGVFVSMTLPSLIVGTVGGGTGLPRQNEWLQMMDCAGAGRVRRFAEIIAGFCLSLDLSTMSAIINGQFAAAHQRLGRNRPVDPLREAELTPEFLGRSLREHFDDPELVVTEATPIDVSMAPSIVSEMTSHRVDKLVGHVSRRLDWTTGSGDRLRRDVVIKVRATDEEVIHTANTVAGLCGARVGEAHRKVEELTGFAACHERELAIYASSDPRLTANMPRVYGVHRDPERQTYLVVMERLQDMVLMDSADDPTGWTAEHVDDALRGAAEFHAIWYGREAELLEQPWIGRPPSTQTMLQMIELWGTLALHAQVEFPEWVAPEDVALQRRLLATIPQWWGEIEAMPRTLVHNDFNPRNVCLRTEPRGGRRLCAYDWELATLHLPQRDLAELLIFVLPEDEDEAGLVARVARHAELHRAQLSTHTRQDIDPALWLRGLKLALYDLLVTRIPYYLMSHTFREYPFMRRILFNCRRVIDIVGQLQA